MATNSLSMKIRGARTHNLQNLSVDIPLNSFVVVTGRSGSGKSSLAIDTIFAEGQRQYIECLSLYARNFFPISSMIDVDEIQGLQPTVCISQNQRSHNPRSTVGTITEVYDHLRLLWSKIGKAKCPGCGKPVSPMSLDQICAAIRALESGSKAMILAPVVRGRKGKQKETFEKIRKERLVRVRIDGQLHDIEQLPDISATSTHHIEAVTDRIIIREGNENRLMESVRLAAELAGGLVLVSSKAPDSENEWVETLFSSHAGCPDCNLEVPVLEPRLFSFNSPYGACQACNGVGKLESFVVSRVIPDRKRSISSSAIAIWQKRAGEKKNLRALKPILDDIRFDTEQPLSEMSDDSWARFLNENSKEIPGLITLLEKQYTTCVDDDDRDWLEQFRGQEICPTCRGSRLNQNANSVYLNHVTISELASQSIAESMKFLDELSLTSQEALIAEQIVPAMKNRLSYLLDVGLDYLSLNRPADTLSGGELQRVRLASAIGSGLTGTCYVLDEPSAGMHERDTERLIRSLRNLQARGNSLVVVEHDSSLMREADYIIDLGPGAGSEGGHIVAEGTYEQILEHRESLTAAYLSGREKVTAPPWTGSNSRKSIRLCGARGFNLKSIDVEFPLGKLICVTGVSGSGKSSLINSTLRPAIAQHLGLLSSEPEAFDSIEGLEAIEKMVSVDPSAISRSSRGCAATHTGIMDDVRKIFAATKLARQRGYTASRFSFNSTSGRCSECAGHGSKKIAMRFMADVNVPCEACHGARYNQPTLSVTFRNQSIADVLESSVDDALQTFDAFDGLRAKLHCLQKVGLGYLKLGQPSPTLSGGESQRIKLATALASPGRGGAIYLLDEPTCGLHSHDVQLITNVLAEIVQNGNTVIVIEHNLDLIRNADQIIDLGPDAGQHGGEVVVAGNLQDVMDCERSETGKALRKQIKC